MSGTMIQELRAASRLQLELRFQRGSLLDLSPSPLAAPTVNDTPVWLDSERGYGVAWPSARGSLNYGASAKLDFGATGSFFCAFVAPPAGADHALFRKMNWGAGTNGYLAYVSAAGNLVFIWGDGAGYVFPVNRALSPEMARMKANTWCVRWSGGAAWADFNGVNVVSGVALSKTPTPAGQNFIVGRDATFDFANPSPVLEIVASNTFLTAAESARLYTDWLKETYARQLPRRNFVSFYQGKSSAEYAAQGIVLDTDFGSEMSAGTRRIKDLTGNYPGTLTGVVVPGQNGEGCQLVEASQVQFGTIPATDNVAQLTRVEDVQLASTIPAGRYFLTGSDGVSNTVGAYTSGSAWRAVFVIGGVTNYGETGASLLKASLRYHVTTVFNGAGATNAERLKVYVDGEQVALTFSGTIPVTIPAGLVWRQGFNPIACPGTYRQARMLVRSWTPDQVRADYLQWAKNLIRRETLEDVPVTLTASVAAGDKIGPWNVTADTWACVEAATGKRSLKHIGNGTGVLTATSMAAFGTWRFRLKPSAVSVQEHLCMFMASVPGWYNAAGQNGYMIYLNVNQAYLFAITGGGTASIASTAAGTIALGTEYEFIVNRRPSDGRFFVYCKGGIWTDWTLIMTAAHPTHLSSNYVNLGSTLRQDEFPLYDPADPNVGYFVYQGQLNPMMGEISGSSLQNLLRYSEQFDNALWTKSNMTVTPNAAASPYGTPNIADLLTATAGGTTAAMYQGLTTAVPVAPYTASMYVKASVGTDLYLNVSDLVTGYMQARFNPATGALVSLSAGTYGNVSAGSESIGGGWYRVWLTGTQPAAQTNLRMIVNLANNADAVYAWGAQLTQGPCAGAYVERE